MTNQIQMTNAKNFYTLDFDIDLSLEISHSSF